MTELAVLIIDQIESLQQQGIIADDLMFAVRCDERRDAASGNNRGILTKLLLQAVDHADQHGSRAEYAAALHTFNRVLADCLLRRFKADAGKLRGTADHRIQRDTHTGMITPPR